MASQLGRFRHVGASGIRMTVASLLPTRAARSKGHASNSLDETREILRRRVYELLSIYAQAAPARQHNWSPRMDEIFKSKIGGEPAPRVAEVSIVPPEHPAVDAPSRDGLLSHETSAAVGSAFNTLTQAVRKQNSQTLEDLVREILQPRLASWLDDNLPNLVERMVEAEVERITRGR